MGTGLRPDRADKLLGVLHDVGHEVATLRYLLAELRSDSTLSPAAVERVRAAEDQLGRVGELVDLTAGAPAPEPVPVRAVLGRLVSVSGGASVRLRPGPDVTLWVPRTSLWRMVANLVQNASRAAGPTGTVEVAVGSDERGVVIEVVDDGPGFGAGTSGTATRGLRVVVDLARDCGARLRFVPAHPTGTRACLEFDNIGGKK